MGGLLTRIRSVLRESWVDPTNKSGSPFDGLYELRGSRVVGSAAHLSGAYKRPPCSVVVLRDGHIIGTTDSFERRGNSFDFTVETDSEFTQDDVLRDRLTVFALDRVGARYPLKISGAIQLAYVKQAFSDPSAMELEIDFAQGGNSNQYVQSGWYQPESSHTWTKGLESKIKIPISVPRSEYVAEMIVSPFLAPGRITEQILTVRIGELLLNKSYIRKGLNFVEFSVPADSTSGASVSLQFDHPGAVRACDYLPTKDGRIVAFAFKSLTLRRKLD